MSQLYIDHFNAKGNPELNAETLQNVELSSLLRPTEWLKLRLDAFASFMDNLILNEFDESLAVPFLGIDGKFVSKQENAARIYGFEFSVRAMVSESMEISAHYNFLESEATRGNNAEYESLDYDARHRASLGLAWLGEDFVTSLNTFFVGPTRETEADLPGEVATGTARDVPLYVILQPHAQVQLPGDFGALIQASYAISEGISEAPTTHYYEEMLDVPVPRFTFLIGVDLPLLAKSLT